MSQYLDEMDVIEICARAGAKDDPELNRYAKFLVDWVRVVGTNSDGWAYWRAGSQAGIKLAELLRDATQGKSVSPAEWGRAIGGIKRAASGQKKHGNMIEVPELELGDEGL